MNAVNSVRLKYSGLVNFASRIISVATGLMFTVVVTRRLSRELFGTWQFYSSLLGYFTIPSSIVNYWLIRETGRGRKVAFSGVFFNSIISMVSAVLFILISPFLKSSVTVDEPTVLAFVIWIVAMYCASGLESVCYGAQPQTVGYGTIVFETSKVFYGLVLVGYFRLLFFGAVISVDLALFTQAYFYLLKLKHLGGSLSVSDFKRWFRAGWIPLISISPGLVMAQDVVVLTLLTGSLLPAAYIRAANVFAGVISFSTSLAVGLYPKLLSGGTGRDVEESLELVLLFLIPMLLGQLILAEPLLYILREEYAVVYNVLRILLVYYAVIVLKGIFSTVVMGSEKTDVNENTTWKKLANSYLMKIPLTELTGSIAYVVIVSVITKVLNDLKISLELISLSTVSCLLSINVVLMLYYLKISLRLIKFSLNLERTAKLIVSAVLMSLILILLYPESAKSGQIVVVLKSLMPTIIVGAVTYFTVLCIIDAKTRDLLKEVLKTLGMRRVYSTTAAKAS